MHDIQPGCRVRVPFGRRQVVGVVTEIRAHTDVPPAKLRSALEVIDPEPTFDPALLKLLLWSADYYRHPIGEVVAAALPVPLREGVSIREDEIVWCLTDLGREQALDQLPA